MVTQIGRNVASLYGAAVLIAFYVAWLFSQNQAWSPTNLLWTCNVGLTAAVAGVLFHDKSLTGAGFLLLAIPGIGWVIDLVGYMFTGVWVFQGANYMLDSNVPILARITSCHHLFFPPLLACWLYTYGYSRQSLGLATIVVVVTFAITLRVADPADHVNWLWRFPLFGETGFDHHAWVYFYTCLYLFVILCIPHLLMIRAIPSTTNAGLPRSAPKTVISRLLRKRSRVWKGP